VSFIGIPRSVGDGVRAATTEAPQWALSRRGRIPGASRVLYRNTNSHALFAAEIQPLARENMALSLFSAVVSSSWLLRAATLQKAPFKMTFAGLILHAGREVFRWKCRDGLGGLRGGSPSAAAMVIVPFGCVLPKKICRRCGPKQYILAVRHWPPVF
jgi:hypothetical protein